MKTVRKLFTPLLLLILLSIPLFYQDKIIFLIQAQFVLSILSNLLSICVWIVSAWFVIRFLNYVFWPIIIENKIQLKLPKLLKDFVSGLVILISFGGILTTVFEQSLTSLLAASGIAGIVIGFAIKEIISDFFSGIILNLNPPYKTGDWIKLENDEWAKVEEINWRATVFEDFYSNSLIIPNSKMSKMKIRNFERPKKHCVQTLEIFLDFKLSTERVMNILKSAAIEGQDEIGIKNKTLNPIVSINKINNFGVSYYIYYYIPDVNGWMSYRSIVYSKIINHLYQAGLRPSYPNQDLHLDKIPKQKLRQRDKNKILSRTDFFIAFHENEIRELSNNLVEKEYDENQEIVIQNNKGDSMFFIVEGVVDVLMDFENNGNFNKVTSLGSGNFFGEMSLLTGEKRSASIISQTKTLVYELTKENFQSIIRKRPETALQISKVVAERKLSSEQSFKKLSEEERSSNKNSITTEIYNKIKSFFNLMIK
tara:strand:- start:314 stop:1756 length:1443 start_codon:yes stop_codon:yes gene_type:complete